MGPQTGRLSESHTASDKDARLASYRSVRTADSDPEYSRWSKRVIHNKSWIAIDWSALQRPLVEGDKIDLHVDYFLDPSEHYQATTLRLEALGPRVPKAGAPEPVSFENTQHIWYGEQSAKIQPGLGTHVFPLTIPRASSQNDLLLLALFCDSRGNRWPWDVRANAWFARRGGGFELETERPGNLFTYEEPVRILARLNSLKLDPPKQLLRYKVWDASKALVAQGSVPLKVQKSPQMVPVRLDLTQRGTFLFQAELDGIGMRETTFCRIPDLATITGGKPTRLGFTVHAAPQLGVRTSQVFQIARRLGLTSCRAFTEWNSIEPGPGHFALKHWDGFFAAAAASGTETVITIYDPPAWALARGRHVGYQMFECNLDAFAEMVKTVSQRYRGKFWGWEWLNEITPGGTPDYVSDYARLCRAGVQAARAVDPSLRSVLAGGLWPRGFRLEVLNAGTGKEVDVLPIHYGNGAAIQEARADLGSFGLHKVGVWENESCAFVIQWDCPGLERVSETSKCSWVLTQWTDELSAGCEKLFYFGGEGAAIGYGDYVLGDFTPMPVAATLSVFAAKTFEARPIGVFSIPESLARFHVFERSGKPILIACPRGSAREEVPLAVGTRSVRVTDYQGNERVLAATNGGISLPLEGLGCFVEGADMDVLKSYLVPSIDGAFGGEGRARGESAPQINLLQGKSGSIPIRLQNLCDRRLDGILRLDLPPAWSTQQQLSFSLKPGARLTLAVPVTVPQSAQLQIVPHRLTVTFDRPGLPRVTKPFALCVNSPEGGGNLLRNGDFELVDNSTNAPTHWSGTNAGIASSAGMGLGLGKNVLRFSRTRDWAHFGQSVKLRGATTYLYTAWVWNQGMEGGSNINQTMKDWHRSDLYDNHVFNIGDSTPSWQVFTCRYQAPENLVEAAFVPVVKGSGSALFDNLRVTVFEGTDFAAEAIKLSRPPAIDGKLDDWDGRCPIPLIGRNQARITRQDYRWTPQNLSGVAYLRWDERNLYVALDELDDVHFPAGDGENVIEGDSVILAVNPTGRSGEAQTKSFAYYLSARKPAGGSGANTLWRPRLHSAGRPAGHLARDSSVYELAVAAKNSRCAYELRIPWSELGITPDTGAKFGCSIQLNDCDGSGPAAQMNWGGGLSPSWHPASFGLITLVE
jgi:hypothetical protein